MLWARIPVVVEQGRLRLQMLLLYPRWHSGCLPVGKGRLKHCACSCCLHGDDAGWYLNRPKAAHEVCAYQCSLVPRYAVMIHTLVLSNLGLSFSHRFSQ